MQHFQPANNEELQEAEKLLKKLEGNNFHHISTVATSKLVKVVNDEQHKKMI